MKSRYLGIFPLVEHRHFGFASPAPKPLHCATMTTRPPAVPGLSSPSEISKESATRLEDCFQGLKPSDFEPVNGTTEVVP